MEHQNDNPKLGSKRETPAWLVRVQEQSWEPEILISSIVLFGLFQVPALLERLQHFLTHYSLEIFSWGTADETMLTLLKVANIWLIAGFMVHLLLRSIWVALVGLSYVYKDGIKVEQLKFKEKFNQALFKNRTYESNIIRLEEICSTSFAISFLLFMCILGAFFLLSIVALALALAHELFPDFRNYGWIDPFLMGVVLIYLIDFLTLGLLKRIPYLSNIYYPAYKVMSLLSLSPLYRKIYYGLVSNHKPWKSIVAILLFVGISTLMILSIRNEENIADVIQLRVSENDEQLLFPGHYENLSGGKPSSRIMIPSDIIDGDVLRVFLVHRSAFEGSYILPLCNYEGRKDTMNADTLAMECLLAFYKLKLDGAPVEADYLFHEKMDTKQIGLQAYLDIAHLDRGMHKLELIYHFSNDDGSIDPTSMAVVEFYKSGPKVPTPIEMPSSFEK